MTGCISGNFSYSPAEQGVFKQAVERKIISNHGRLINNCSDTTAFGRVKASVKLAKERADNFVPKPLVYMRSRVEQERRFGEIALEKLYAKVLSDIPTHNLEGDELQTALDKQTEKIAFFLDEVSVDNLEHNEADQLQAEKSEFWADYAKSGEANKHFGSEAFGYSHPDLQAFSKAKRFYTKGLRGLSQTSDLFLLKFFGPGHMVNAMVNKNKAAKKSTTPLCMSIGALGSFMLMAQTFTLGEGLLKESKGIFQTLGGFFALGYGAHAALRSTKAAKYLFPKKALEGGTTDQLNDKERFIAQQGKLAAREMFITLTRNANALKQLDGSRGQSLRDEADTYVERKAKDYESALNTKISRQFGQQLRGTDKKALAGDIQADAAKRFLRGSSDDTNAEPIGNMQSMIKTALTTLHEKKSEQVGALHTDEDDTTRLLNDGLNDEANDFANRKLSRYVTLGMRHALGLSSGGKSPALLIAASKELGSRKVAGAENQDIATDLVPDSTSADKHLAVSVGEWAWKKKQTAQVSVGLGLAYLAKPIGGRGAGNVELSSEEFTGVSKVLMKCARWCTTGVKADHLHFDSFKRRAANFKEKSETRTNPELAHRQFGTANHALANPHQYGKASRFLAATTLSLLKVSEACHFLYGSLGRMQASVACIASNKLDRGLANSIGYFAAAPVGVKMAMKAGEFAFLPASIALKLAVLGIPTSIKLVGAVMGTFFGVASMVPAALLTASSRSDFRGDLLEPELA